MDDMEVLARTIYGEARGEFKRIGLQALEAIGHVVMNRVRQQTWFGKTVTEVCLKPMQFSCWNKTDPNYEIISKPILSSSLMDVCRQVAKSILTGKAVDVTGGCDHYHSRFCVPIWAHGQHPKCAIGNHIFFDLRRKK
jgi:N-acetylmuramoyl-L-alanine amidase